MKYLASFLAWIAGVTFVLLMLPLSFLIWFFVWPFDNNRVVFHRWLVFQSLVITWLIPSGPVQFEGLEKIKKGYNCVIISNHQSILDILILNRMRVNFKWISKIENTRVPVLGWYLKMAGYIPVERGNKESRAVMMEASVKVLKKGISIMIFPEGTRSADGEVGFFKQGAFELAMITDKPILPVVIDGTGKILPRHSRIFNPGIPVKVKVLDPVFPGSFGTSDPAELVGKFREMISGELKKMRSGMS